MKFPMTLALCASGLLSACVIDPVHLSADAGAPPPEVTTTAPAQEPVLYARDGTPVPAARSVAHEAPGIPAHGVQDGESSRMYLLELYQEAIDTKEALELDVRSLTADLDLAREEVAMLQAELLETRAAVQRLEVQRDRQQEELRELAQRLVTAQIRRLESDKALLQTKIDWARTREVIESTAREGAGGPR